MAFLDDVLAGDQAGHLGLRQHLAADQPAVRHDGSVLGRRPGLGLDRVRHLPGRPRSPTRARTLTRYCGRPVRDHGRRPSTIRPRPRSSPSPSGPTAPRSRGRRARATSTYLGEIPLSLHLRRTTATWCSAICCSMLLAPDHARTPPGARTHRGRQPRCRTRPSCGRSADTLAAEEVPFSVTVIPEYRDPKGVLQRRCAARSARCGRPPAVVSALRYMQSKGGTLVMHGWTHQFDGLDQPVRRGHRATTSSSSGPTSTGDE